MNGVSSTFGPPTVSDVVVFGGPSGRANVTTYWDVRLAATFFSIASSPDKSTDE